MLDLLVIYIFFLLYFFVIALMFISVGETPFDLFFGHPGNYPRNSWITMNVLFCVFAPVVPLALLIRALVKRFPLAVEIIKSFGCGLFYWFRFFVNKVSKK
jgi:hypothetical protein